MVAAIVDGCSDAETVPKPPWRERKEAFLSSLRNASPQIRRVVAADKLHNVRSLRREFQRQGEVIWERFRGGKEGTLWYHREAAKILEEKGAGWLVTALKEAVADLEDLTRHA
jgi:(p)ppGpp synthase/HD superfamily hydrolase